MKLVISYWQPQMWHILFRFHCNAHVLDACVCVFRLMFYLIHNARQPTAYFCLIVHFEIENRIKEMKMSLID
jgi:hypothetical protein